MMSSNNSTGANISSSDFNFRSCYDQLPFPLNLAFPKVSADNRYIKPFVRFTNQFLNLVGALDAGPNNNGLPGVNLDMIEAATSGVFGFPETCFEITGKSVDTPFQLIIDYPRSGTDENIILPQFDFVAPEINATSRFLESLASIPEVLKLRQLVEAEADQGFVYNMVAVKVGSNGSGFFNVIGKMLDTKQFIRRGLIMKGKYSFSQV